MSLLRIPEPIPQILERPMLVQQLLPAPAIEAFSIPTVFTCNVVLINYPERAKAVIDGTIIKPVDAIGAARLKKYVDCIVGVSRQSDNLVPVSFRKQGILREHRPGEYFLEV